MKNPLQTLLMFFALSLCGLCTWQWYAQTLQRKELTAVAQVNYDQAVAIQGYTNTINNMDRQIAQTDARLTELRGIINSNNVVIIRLNQDNSRLNSLVDQYSNVVGVVQIQIKQANESIRQQNEAIKGLVAERDEYVKRLNESLKERNAVISKYNELVKQVEEMQAAQAKQQKK